MAIKRMNHAVLYVRDVAESVAFYRDVLGFGYIDGGDAHRGAAFLRAPGSANDHDLGLFEIGADATDSGAGRTSVGLYHLAWEVDTLGDLVRLAEKLQAAGSLVGAIGVSGAPGGDADEACAKAGIEAIQARLDF